GPETARSRRALPEIPHPRVSRLSRGTQMCRLLSLEDCSDALTGADAHGGQPEGGLLVFHRMNQRRRDAGSAGAEGVPNRNGTAADVYLFWVGLEKLHDGQGLGRERFIDFNEVDIG